MRGQTVPRDEGDQLRCQRRKRDTRGRAETDWMTESKRGTGRTGDVLVSAFVELNRGHFTPEYGRLGVCVVGNLDLKLA